MFVNYICSPEMSLVAIEPEEEPHAYLHFADDSKVISPLRFVRLFPKAWRTESWDKKYLFKTFWSPDDNDTPESILKKMPEVPCFEEGHPERAGYYRASVLAVAETRSALEALIEKKRLSILPLSRKYSSFDKKSKQQKQQSKSKSKKKSKGINRVATRANMEDECPKIKKLYPFLQTEDTNIDDPEEKKPTKSSLDKSANKISTTIRKSDKGGKVSTSPATSDCVGKFVTSEPDISGEKSESTNLKDLKTEPKSQRLGIDFGSHFNSSKGEKTWARSKADIDREKTTILKGGKISTSPATSDCVGKLVTLEPDISGEKSESTNLKDLKTEPMSQRLDIDFGSDYSENEVTHGSPPYRPEWAMPQYRSASPSEESCSSSVSTRAREVQDNSSTASSVSTVCVTPVKQNCSSSLPGSTTPERRNPARTKTPKSAKRNSSPSSDSSVEVKKRKMDPDFTPVKYEALKDDIKIAESRLRSAHELNKKLRESLKLSEDSNSALQNEVEKLKKELKKISGSKDNVKSEFERKHVASKSQFETKCRSSNSEAEKEKKSKENHMKESKKQDSKHSFSKANLKVMGHSDKFVAAKTKQNDTLQSIDSKDLDDDGTLPSVSHFCQVEEDSGESTQKPFELLPGVIIPADVWALLKSVPKGEKKDIPFMKDLSVYAHGPETLASHSICGTKKGGRKKKGELQEPKEAKPALNKAVLKAVHRELVKRVEAEEGIKIDDNYEDHERTTLKRYHEAIRGAQRRLRDLGFGTGAKSDSNVEINLLQNSS